MAKSEKDKKRYRPIILQTRVTEDEAALVRTQAEKARVSVSALIRYALLDQPPLRASPAATVDEELGARLLASLGAVKAAMVQASQNTDSETCAAEFEAACRDLSEMRNLWFEAHGREP